MFTQYQLPYGYDALEPVIDAATLETHHSKHHAAYTATLNTLAEKAGVADQEITALLSGLDAVSDETLRTGLRNNGGGFYNHNFYFEQLAPKGRALSDDALKAAIDRDLGGFDKFREDISALALGQFGSGWAWLSATPEKTLVLSKTPNQDNDFSLKTGNTPLFTIDVWEHAYYLKYRNLRAEYVKAIWDIIDWEKVAARYAAL